MQDKQSKDSRVNYDMDMFDFVYSAVSTVDSYERIRNPFDHKLFKFDKPVRGKDSDSSEMLNPRVFSDGGNITVCSDNLEDFNDILAICEMYKIKNSSPREMPQPTYYWKYHLTIEIPVLSDGYPMLVEDYFSDIGFTLREVMCDLFCDGYEAHQRRLKKEQDEHLAEVAFKRIYDNAVTYAWQRGDIPLAEHFSNLIQKLTDNGVPFKKTLLRNKFMSEFADDDGDDEEALEAIPLF